MIRVPLLFSSFYFFYSTIYYLTFFIINAIVIGCNWVSSIIDGVAVAFPINHAIVTANALANALFPYGMLARV